MEQLFNILFGYIEPAYILIVLLLAEAAKRVLMLSSTIQHLRPRPRRIFKTTLTMCVALLVGWYYYEIQIGLLENQVDIVQYKVKMFLSYCVATSLYELLLKALFKAIGKHSEITTSETPETLDNESEDSH